MPSRVPSTDLRFQAVKPLIANGKIRSFPDIFRYIKKSVIRDHMGWGEHRLQNIMSDPGKLTINECVKMDTLFELRKGSMSKMVTKDVQK